MTSSSKDRFVICGRPEINKIVAQDMRKVIHAICEELGAVDAIILEGSYGRGEGAMIHRDERWMPVNDYDFCLVTDRTVSKSSLETIRRKVLSESDIWRVDFSTISREGLRALKPRMVSFDRKYGSQVVYGDAGVLDLIPEMRAEDIPLFEAEKEFYTRMTAFVLSFQTSFLKRNTTDDEAYRLRQQLAKALVACANASLFVKGQYRASAVEREELVEEAATFDNDSMELIKAAFHFKAFPDRDPQAGLVEYYFQCRALYLRCFRELLNTMYKRDFKSWTSYAQAYLHSPRNLALRFRGWLKRDKAHYRSLHLNLAQLFLVVGLERDGAVRTEEQNRIRNYLSRCSGVEERRSGWDELREATLALRM